MRAVQGGTQFPAQLKIEGQLASFFSRASCISALADAIRRTRKYLEVRYEMEGTKMPKTKGRIFIGHGRSEAWKVLRDFIRDRLHLESRNTMSKRLPGFPEKNALRRCWRNRVLPFLS